MSWKTNSFSISLLDSLSGGLCCCSIFVLDDCFPASAQPASLPAHSTSSAQSTFALDKDSSHIVMFFPDAAWNPQENDRFFMGHTVWNSLHRESNVVCVVVAGSVCSNCCLGGRGLVQFVASRFPPRSVELSDNAESSAKLGTRCKLGALSSGSVSKSFACSIEEAETKSFLPLAVENPLAPYLADSTGSAQSTFALDQDSSHSVTFSPDDAAGSCTNCCSGGRG